MQTAQATDTDFSQTYRENCLKCRGRGTFVGYTGRVFGTCFTCKGVGYKEFKRSSGDRAKARTQVANRKARIDGETIAMFAAAEPAVWAWIEANPGFDFAVAMRDAVVKFGTLTEAQRAACQRGIERDANRKADAEARVNNAPAVDTTALTAAFDAAKAKGLKRPIMRFEGFQASLAPATGANAGAIYLKADGVYLGKIKDGKLLATRECLPAKVDAIQAAMADPLTSAVAYGRRTGSCSCCGRPLENKVSVDRGIGPICAEKFGL